MTLARFPITPNTAELQQDEPALLVRAHSCTISSALEVPGFPKHCTAEIRLWRLECHIHSPLWIHSSAHTFISVADWIHDAVGLLCFLPVARSHCPLPLPALHISIFLLITWHWSLNSGSLLLYPLQTSQKEGWRALLWFLISHLL